MTKDELNGQEIDNKHNQTAPDLTPTGQRLRAYIDRIERLEEAKKEIMDDIKEVYAEAKGDGFEVKIVRKVVAIRKKDSYQIAEEQEVLDTYLNALGMTQGNLFS